MQLPARPRLDENRDLVRDPGTGKVQYVKTLGFPERDRSESAWSTAGRQNLPPHRQSFAASLSESHRAGLS